MSTEAEVAACVAACDPEIIFHTNSTYPAPADELNLNYIKVRFGLPPALLANQSSAVLSVVRSAPTGQRTGSGKGLVLQGYSAHHFTASLLRAASKGDVPHEVHRILGERSPT
jgi:hypothetical protein